VVAVRLGLFDRWDRDERLTWRRWHLCERDGLRMEFHAANDREELWR
jgi:hypothetical protein